MNLYYFLRHHKKSIILGPIFKLVESIFELIIPVIMANIIDLGIKNQDILYIIKMGYFIIALLLLGFISAIICQYMAARASQGIGSEIRNALYEKINSVSFYEIDKIGTASLTTRITSDVSSLQNAIAMSIRLGARIPFIVFGSLIMAYIIDKQLSIIFFIAVPVISVISFIIAAKSSRLFTISRYKLDKLSHIAKENLDGVRVIRAFSRQKGEINRFNKASEEYLSNGISALKIFSLMPPSAYVIVNSVIILIIWLGAMRINSGNLMPGKITALINYTTQILFALFLAASLLTTFTKAYASYRRIFDVLNIENEVIPENSISSYTTSNFSYPKVEFKNINFSYTDSDETQLSNINFKIMTGETLGIIGSTGSGKTTIAKLLLKFYSANQGEVLLNGVNICQYDTKFLRKKIKAVPQDAVLFSGTIEENLRMGNEKISTESINKALYISRSMEFVNSMPEKIQSYIERGGKSLSGGQRQRLTIARAIAAEPEILLLDDSMSALDAGTSSKLKSSLDTLNGMTKIIISQKITDIWNANQILVLDNGKSVGLGTHKYLLKECNIYKDLYKSQGRAKKR